MKYCEIWIKDLLLGIGKVLKVTEEGIRAEVYEFRDKEFFGEPALENILFSHDGKQKWTHKTRVMTNAQLGKLPGLNIDNQKYNFYTIKGWLEGNYYDFAKTLHELDSLGEQEAKQKGEKLVEQYIPLMENFSNNRSPRFLFAKFSFFN